METTTEASQTVVRFSDIKYVINENTKLLSNVSLNYNFSNNAQTVSAWYQGTGGTVFNTSGIKNSALYYRVGLGIQREIKDNFILNLKYNIDGKGSSFQNHTVWAKFRYKF